MLSASQQWSLARMSLIKCPDCRKDVSSNAEACPTCAAPIRKQDKTKASSNESSRDSTRSAIAQYEVNRTGWGVLFFQSLIIGAAVGGSYESWYWFVGIVLGGWVLLAIPYVGKLMAILLSAAWGAVAAAVAAHFTENDQTAMVVSGIVVFMLAAGINVAGVDHLKDVGGKK